MSALSSSSLLSSPSDGWEEELTVCECSRIMFEALEDGAIDKLRSIIAAYSADDVVHTLLHRNANDVTPLAFAIKTNWSNGLCAEELVTFLQRWHQHRVGAGELPEFDDECFTLFASVIDGLCGGIPILGVLEYLINAYCCVAWLELLARVFVNSTILTREDKIIALELIGGYLIMDDTPFRFRPFQDSAAKIGLQLWRQAMSLRLLPANGEPLLPKIPHLAVPTEASVAVFGSLVEVTTMEELDVLQEQVERHFHTLQSDGPERRPLSMLLHGHALLVARRISKQSYADGPYALYLRYLMCFPPIHANWDVRYGEDFGEENNLALSTCLLILEQVNGYDPENISLLAFGMLSRALRLMSTLFITLVEKPPGTPGRELLSCANLLVLPQFLIAILKYFEAPRYISFVQWDGFDSFGELVIRFLYVVTSMSSQLTDGENQQLEDFYSNIICSYFAECSTTVLHAAYRHAEDFEDDSDAELKLVRLVLKLGADPNAIDECGLAPLHRLAAMNECLPDVLPVFQVLVDAGGHLDMATCDGGTVLDVVKQSLQHIKDSSEVEDYSPPPYYASLLKKVFPLSCLCARVIREHAIPFDGGRLPLRLQEFVARHRPTEVCDENDGPPIYAYRMGC